MHGNAKEGTKPTSLKTSVPLWGPRFVPPTYTTLRKRDPVLAEIKPSVSYLKPLIVVHPFYDCYPDLRKCPQCGSADKKKVKWDSWQNTGYREVRGIYHGETALGYQLRCEDCEVQDKVHCFSTTSLEFWKKWELWNIPSTFFSLSGPYTVTEIFVAQIPVFFAHSAVTRELFDLLIEFRPSLTSAGLAEHIKRKLMSTTMPAVYSLTVIFRATSS